MNGNRAPKKAIPQLRFIVLTNWAPLSSKPRENIIRIMPNSEKTVRNCVLSTGSKPTLTITEPKPRKYRTGVNLVLWARYDDRYTPAHISARYSRFSTTVPLGR
jgi:hypothetical protein